MFSTFTGVIKQTSSDAGTSIKAGRVVTGVSRLWNHNVLLMTKYTRARMCSTKVQIHKQMRPLTPRIHTRTFNSMRTQWNRVLTTLWLNKSVLLNIFIFLWQLTYFTVNALITNRTNTGIIKYIPSFASSSILARQTVARIWWHWSFRLIWT